MAAQLSRTNSSFHGVPIIKLGNSKTSVLRESLLSISQKPAADNEKTIQKKTNTPSSLRPVSRNLSQSGSMFLTPKEKQSNNKNSPQAKSALNDGQKHGAFTDYYNQQCLQPNKLPSINKSMSNKFPQKSNLEEGSSSAPKMARHNIHNFSSEVSSFDQASSASTQDNMERTKGKSSFFCLKPQPFSVNQSKHESSSINNNSHFASIQSEFATIPEDRQVKSNNISPQHANDPAGFLNKQQQQQLNIKTLYEEQKRQLNSVEEFTSPFPPKSQHKKPSGRMSLNTLSVTDITQQSHQQKILYEQIGGQSILRTFVSELLLAMKKSELFDIFLEDYHQDLDIVQDRLCPFILLVLSDNNAAVLASVQDFLASFYSLTDATIFQLKAFLFEFLTNKACINNIFLDKDLAFKLIEFLEENRSVLTDNEEALNLFEVSHIHLKNNVIEHCVTSEFFKKFDLDKISEFSKGLIDLLFNRISSQDLISLFLSVFNTSLTQAHLNLLKDVLKKALADLREYNSVFRKNISYQLKKVQWILPSSTSAPNYIEIVRSCPDLDNFMSKIAPQIMEAPHQVLFAFAKFLKLFYSKYNVFNMTDIFQVFDSKQAEQSKQRMVQLSSVLCNALLASKISVELSKKIETFTLSIFD